MWRCHGYDMSGVIFSFQVLFALWTLFYSNTICENFFSSKFHKHRCLECSNDQHSIQTLSWAVKLNPTTDSSAAAARIVKETGLISKGPIAHLQDYYEFEHHFWEEHRGHCLDADLQCDLDDYTSIHDYIGAMLNDHDDVEWFSHQVARRRVKRALEFNDPMYELQWHLHSLLNNGMDVNVLPVWTSNITGRGVTVAVIDDGLEWNNVDLKLNYNAAASWDLNDNDGNPMPSQGKKNHHGTRCAGEIAAVANNNVCVVGVAYNANIAGIRILSGPMTDTLEATAFTKNMEQIDIYSCSWGPGDDGKTVDGPHYFAQLALRHAVEYGRHGYGNIFVVASGNGGLVGDNCNFDGYATSIYTVTIGAVDEAGRMPYYAEECASMLAVTFSSGSGRAHNIVTTDWSKGVGTSGCTESHTGTSAAAPLAAGIIALMLEVQPCLTWRDVQHIIVLTSTEIDDAAATWFTNSAGLVHSHQHGFGLLNAHRVTLAASVWQPIAWLTSYTSPEIHENRAISFIPDATVLSLEVTSTDLSGLGLYIMEYVYVIVTLSHPNRGDLQMYLKCPSQSQSLIASTRTVDNSSAGYKEWKFATVRCWGEKPEGKWTFIIEDTGDPDRGHGVLEKWQLRIYGSPTTFEDYQERKTSLLQFVSSPSSVLNRSTDCPPPPLRNKPNSQPLSIKTIKVLILLGIFCLCMGVYESIEFLCCYNKEKKEHLKELQLEQKSRELAAGDNNDTSECTSLLTNHESESDHNNVESLELAEIMIEQHTLSSRTGCHGDVGTQYRDCDTDTDTTSLIDNS